MVISWLVLLLLRARFKFIYNSPATVPSDGSRRKVGKFNCTIFPPPSASACQLRRSLDASSFHSVLLVSYPAPRHTYIYFTLTLEIPVKEKVADVDIVNAFSTGNPSSLSLSLRYCRCCVLLRELLATARPDVLSVQMDVLGEEDAMRGSLGSRGT